MFLYGGLLTQRTLKHQPGGCFDRLSPLQQINPVWLNLVEKVPASSIAGSGIVGIHEPHATATSRNNTGGGPQSYLE